MSAHLLHRWRHEKDAAWLYEVVAQAEPNTTRRRLFEKLGVAAEVQAGLIVKDMPAPPGRYHPSLRARLLALAVRRFGPRRLRSILGAAKVRGLSVYNAPSAATPHVMPTSVQDFGHRHRRPGNLRAAIFGLNDGVLSNAALMIGVAQSGQALHTVLLTGIAGGLAGALSMAAGEYISVRSQRELYEHQIAEERDELQRYPAEEAEELALIYEARGLALPQARELVTRLFEDKEQALRELLRDELGLNPDDLGQPWGAAFASFTAFALGASVPVLPMLFVHGAQSVAWVAAASLGCLFTVGAGTSFFSGQSAWWTGARMFVIGIASLATTSLLGRLLGAQL